MKYKNHFHNAYCCIVVQNISHCDVVQYCHTPGKWSGKFEARPGKRILVQKWFKFGKFFYKIIKQVENNSTDGISDKHLANYATLNQFESDTN